MFHLHCRHTLSSASSVLTSHLACWKLENVTSLITVSLWLDVVLSSRRPSGLISIVIVKHSFTWYVIICHLDMFWTLWPPIRTTFIILYYRCTHLLAGAVSVAVKRPKPSCKKTEKIDADVFRRHNGFGISVFSYTFNTLSICIFEHLYALNFAITNMLSVDVFLCYIHFATSIASKCWFSVLAVIRKGKKSVPTRRFFVRNLLNPTEH